jgi:hypothetical protein
MSNAMNNFEDSNGNGQQYPAGQPADARLPDNTKSTALTQPANTAITEGSLANNNQSVVRGKPLEIVEEEGQFSFTGDKETLRQTFGTADCHLISRWLHDLFESSPSTSLGDAADRNSGLAALHGIGPRDAFEGMIATLMVPLHDQSLAFLQKANEPGQPDHLVDANINRVTKLTKAFSALAETWFKYRSSSTQDVIVGQVHVHQGGKAIVGAVNPQRRATVSEDDHEESR